MSKHDTHHGSDLFPIALRRHSTKGGMFVDRWKARLAFRFLAKSDRNDGFGPNISKSPLPVE